MSLFPHDNADPDTLLRHADQAMYLAKQAGKNRYQLFDPEVDRIAQQRRDQLGRLREDGLITSRQGAGSFVQAAVEEEANRGLGHGSPLYVAAWFHRIMRSL